MTDRWLILLLLFAVRTATGFQFQAVGSSASFLVADLAIDYARLGILIGLYHLPGIVLAVPSGLLGRRFGDRRVVVAALALLAAGGFVMGLSHTYGLAVAGRLLGGIGQVVLDVLLTKMILDWFAGREIVFAMAALLASWPVGLSLGLATHGPLAAATSWQVTMHLTGLAGLAALLLVASLYRAPPSVGQGQAPGPAKPALSRREIGLVLLAGTLWVLFEISFTCLTSFGPDFLASGGYTAAEAGRLASIVSWLTVPALLAGGYLAERVRRSNLMMVACFLAGGVVIWLMPYWDNPLALFSAFGLLMPPAAGVIMALPAEVLRPENRATGLGLCFAVAYGGAATLPALAGLARDLTQDPAAPILFGGTALFVALLFLALFRAIQGMGKPAASEVSTAALAAD